MASVPKKRIPAMIALAVVFLLIVSLAVYFQTVNGERMNDSTLESMMDYVVETLQGRIDDARQQLERYHGKRLTFCRMAAESLAGSGVRAGELPEAADERMRIVDRLTERGNCAYAYLVDGDGNVLYPRMFTDVIYPDNPEPVTANGSVNLKERWAFTEDQWQEMLRGTGERDAEGYITYEPYYQTRSRWEESLGNNENVDCVLYCANVTDGNGEDSGLYVITAEQYHMITSVTYIGLNADFGSNLSDDVKFHYYDSYSDALDPKYRDVPQVEDESKAAEMYTDRFHGELRTADGMRTICTRVLASPGKEGNVYVFAEWDRSGMRTNNYVIYNALIAIVMAVLFAACAWFLKASTETAPCASDCQKVFPGVYLNRIILKKLRPVLVIVLAGALAVTTLVTSLSRVSDAMRNMSAVQDRVEVALRDNGGFQEIKELSQDFSLLQTAEMLAEHLSVPDAVKRIGAKDGSMVLPYYCQNKEGRMGPVTDIGGNELICRADNAGLKRYRDMMQIDEISVYGLDGYAVLTTESSKPVRITEGNILYDVLMRNRNSVIYALREEKVNVAVPVTLYLSKDPAGGSIFISKDEYKTAAENGDKTVSAVDGVLVTQNTLQRGEYAFGLEATVAQAQDNNSMDGYRIMAFSNDEDRSCIYVPRTLSGGDPASMELPKGLLTDTYYGFSWLNGAKYLLGSRFIPKDEYNAAYWMVTALKADAVYAGRTQSILITLACVIAGCAGVTLFAAYIGKEERASLPETPPARQYGDYDYQEKSGVLLPWHMRSPAQKTFTLLGTAFFLFLVVLFARMLIQASTQGSVSVMNWILTRRWERGVNIFSLTAVTLMNGAIIMGIFVLSVVSRLALGGVSGRAATCLSVLLSVLRYGALIFGFFYSLYLMGLDTSSVLTSFAAFSMLIGLGANKLIGDVVAGIFLVVENQFRVGDIVTINDFCGKVTEIGIRTTKVENKDGNVNIFTNSTVTSVLNMTSRTSRVKIELNISSETSIEEVEQMLKEVLPDIERRCPVPHKNLGYLGVDKAGANECVYRVEAECSEYALNILYRYINRELYLACKQRNINLK